MEPLRNAEIPLLHRIKNDLAGPPNNVRALVLNPGHSLQLDPEIAHKYNAQDEPGYFRSCHYKTEENSTFKVCKQESKFEKADDDEEDGEDDVEFCGFQ